MSSADATTLNPPVALKVGWQGAAVVAAWVAVALLISYWPNAVRNWPMTQGLANLCVGVAALFIVLQAGYLIWKWRRDYKRQVQREEDRALLHGKDRYQHSHQPDTDLGAL